MLDCWLDKSNLPEDFAAVRPDRIMTTMQALSTRSLMQALTNWQVTCICWLLQWRLHKRSIRSLSLLTNPNCSGLCRSVHWRDCVDWLSQSLANTSNNSLGSFSLQQSTSSIILAVELKSEPSLRMSSGFCFSSKTLGGGKSDLLSMSWF